MVIIDKIIQKQQIKELAQIIKKNANNDKLNLIYDWSYSLEFDKMLEFVNKIIRTGICMKQELQKIFDNRRHAPNNKNVLSSIRVMETNLTQ